MTEVHETRKTVCERVREAIRAADIRRVPGEASDFSRTHLISPEPFPLTGEQVALLETLGDALAAFYSAANELYPRSEHAWAREYLDIGKPAEIVRHGAMNYQKRALPAVIRPDILMTDHGFVITELDSVPGGIGHLDCLSAAYEEAGFELVGSPRRMRDGFAAMLRDVSALDDPVAAIVVSDESADYLAEMTYLAGELRKIGLRAYTVRPKEVEFTEEGLFIREADGRPRVDVVYRFFELFDLPNIPKSELVAYAARKKLAVVTPPYKHFLEEKMLLALASNESLASFWTAALGESRCELLTRTVAPTCILDSRPVPPHAEISGFRWRGEPIRDWREIASGSQSERRLVVKPSGFSPLAWGSRGVRVGHDMSSEDWAACVEAALASFDTRPHVLQPFLDTALVGVDYYDESSDGIRGMEARVRLCPYYFVVGGKARLAGVLATACPKDKKLIHGMADAVMCPCAVSG